MMKDFMLGGACVYAYSRPAVYCLVLARVISRKRKKVPMQRSLIIRLAGKRGLESGRELCWEWNHHLMLCNGGENRSKVARGEISRRRN